MAGGVDKPRNSEDNKKLIQSFPHSSEPILSKSKWSHNFLSLLHFHPCFLIMLYNLKSVDPIDFVIFYWK